MTANYITSDLAEAAYLFAIRVKLIATEFSGERCQFTFANRSGCEKLVAGYWSREGLVVAKDLADAMRTLKDRIFSLRAQRRAGAA